VECPNTQHKKLLAGWRDHGPPRATVDEQNHFFPEERTMRIKTKVIVYEKLT
jgi:hypothetical protein